jgi:hypothetical protein
MVQILITENTPPFGVFLRFHMKSGIRAHLKPDFSDPLTFAR